MSLIMLWRNEQIVVLRQQRPLTDKDQEFYWKKTIEPGFKEKQPQQILFSFLKEGNCIGYGGMTHIDWSTERAEVSFLLDPERAGDMKSYCEEFKIFLALLTEVAFQDLNFHRLFTETFNIRPEHIKTLEVFGFRLEGILKDHVKVKNQYYDSLIHGLVRNESI